MTGTFAEFFAGIGLVRLGLESAGWKCVFANDIDEQKREMYVTQFGTDGSEFVLGDVHDIDANALPYIDLATASFPCTDLSLAGARKGLAGSQSSALWPFLRVIEDLGDRRPALILLENVVGFLTSHGGSDLRSALKKLNDLQYMVDLFVLDAVRFVPQSRPRLFVVGRRSATRSSTAERRKQYCLFAGETGKEPSVLRPEPVVSFILRNPDIDWSIRGLSCPSRSDLKLDSVLESLPEDSREWWSEERVAYLLNQMSDRHLKIAREMIGGKVETFGTIFRRVRNKRSMAELRVDGIAGCLRTPKGGSGRQILFAAGNGRARARLLTPRECARLMGADDYRITVPLNQALFGFGDAVCVKAIEWIAANYLNPVLNQERQNHLEAIA